VKQKSVSLSTAESEWYAASEAVDDDVFRVQISRWQRTQVTERGRDTLMRACEHFVDQLVKDSIVKLVSAKPTRW
jgi:hypothetical protein